MEDMCMRYFSSSGMLRLIGAALTGAAASTLALALFAPAQPARAADVVRYVAVGGSDVGACDLSTSPCQTPQYAINVSDPGDVIKIATGTYTSVGTIVFTQTNAYTFTQIAFISKTLTISGGYATSNWGVADPNANATVFDAEGYGRGVTIFGSGTEAVTVTGLTLTNGDYTGLGNPIGVSSRMCFGFQDDCGGGFYARQALIQVQNVSITNNVASRTRGNARGGGLYLEGTLDGSTLNAITVTNNAAAYDAGFGGGIDLESVGALTLTNSFVTGNKAKGGGAALSSFSSVGPISISTTRFEANSSQGFGAVAYVFSSVEGVLRFEQVVITDTLSQAGDVLAIINDSGADEIRLTNVLIAGTVVTAPVPFRGLIYADVQGAQDDGTRINAAHITAANNQGLALFEIQAPAPVPSFAGTFTATLTNTLVTDLPALFLPVQSGSSTISITADHTLTESVPALTTGAVGTASITLNNTVGGAALLGTDYRPQALSAAIDAGLDLGIALDASGAARDSQPDIGALESLASPPQKLFLPVLRK